MKRVDDGRASDAAKLGYLIRFSHLLAGVFSRSGHIMTISIVAGTVCEEPLNEFVNSELGCPTFIKVVWLGHVVAAKLDTTCFAQKRIHIDEATDS